MSFRMNTERSSEMRLTLQINILALKRNRYLSLDFASFLSVTDHHSCAIKRPSLWILPSGIEKQNREGSLDRLLDLLTTISFDISNKFIINSPVRDT